MNNLKFVFPLLFLCSCAQIVVPEGGTKDTSPPQIVKTVPSAGSLNIYPKKISLFFSENIELKNQTENISITPDINFKPTFKVKKNKIELGLSKDSLQPNTTYCINFGKSVVDINEGNILENFTFSFSTGNSLDTGVVSGLALTIKENKEIDKSLVTLQNVKNSLKYSTSSNKDGLWKINNLAKGEYTLFIFSDNNSNKKLDYTETFFKRNITISNRAEFYKSKLIIYRHLYDSSKLTVLNAKYINDNSIGIKLNKSVIDLRNIKYSINNNLNKKEYELYSTNKEDSFIIYHSFIENDTLLLNIQTDTFQKLIIIQPKKRTKAQLSLLPALPIIRNDDPIYINSSIPIKLINSDKIKIINGSNEGIIVTKANPYRISITHNKNINKEIILEPGAITDINGSTNKGDTLIVKVAKEEEVGNYDFVVRDSISNFKGNLHVKISNEINEYLIKTELNKINKISGLLPGNYTIEAYEDENNNDKWDEGNYLNNQNPERIILIKNFVLIKPNWDTTGVEIYID